MAALLLPVPTPAFQPATSRYVPQRPADHGACFDQPRGAVVPVSWSRPRPGWYKLNFDGSVYHDGSGRASIGGAIRNSYGHVVAAFAERTEHAAVGVVEAQAMIRGLHLALEMGCDRLVVEGDDLTLVRLLRGESARTRIRWAMYDEIVELLCCFRDCEVRHVYREGNQVAHTLCREAYKFGCPMVWADRLVPYAVWEKVEADRHGVVYERLRAA